MKENRQTVAKEEETSGPVHARLACKSFGLKFPRKYQRTRVPQLKHRKKSSTTGMLPGVEAARRRRFHRSSTVNNNNEYEKQSAAAAISTRRRSSLCLYAGHEYFRLTSNSSVNINPLSQHQAITDESRLDAAAREAKKRLDERLQPRFRRSSETNSQQRSRSLEDRPTVEADVQTEVARVKKSGSKRFSWLKLSRKSSEQEECVVCLEALKGSHIRGETLMQLPCSHKFHTNCLLPWLEANAHCPCCRMEIPS